MWANRQPLPAAAPALGGLIPSTGCSFISPWVCSSLRASELLKGSERGWLEDAVQSGWMKNRMGGGFMQC